MVVDESALFVVEAGVAVAAAGEVGKPALQRLVVSGGLVV